MAETKKKSEAGADKKQAQDSKTKAEQTSLILVVKPTTVIADGRHEGIITDIARRTDPFGYIDILIKEKKTKAELKLGYPDTITERTGLGKFLVKMGHDFSVGDKIDLYHLLLGKPVSFMTENEETEKGVFARVILGTVKPIQ